MQKDNVKFKIILLGILFFGIFGLAKSSWAEDFYVTQNASGSDTGADCANAHSASWFNTGANWGNPKQSGKIGPGDSSHLCGTISTRLATQASGTFENKITIKFEDNAKLSKPSWNGMALLIQKECIVIDGGTNGIIENTDNGTAGSYAYQQNAQGIWADSCNGCEVKNLTIRNLYIHNSNADTAIDNWMTKAIYINGSNLTVHDNIIHDAGSGIIVSYSIGDTNVRIYNNDIYNIDHGMALSSGGSNVGGKFYFYNNHVHDYKNWDTLSNAYHHDGIHAFGVSDGAHWPSVEEFWIYNNIFDGETGVNLTGHIFLEGGAQSGGRTPWTGATGTAYIFNNVFANAWVFVNKGTNHAIYNNTILTNISDYNSGLGVGDTTRLKLKNNYIGADTGGFLSLGCADVTWNNEATDFDYNVYGGCSALYSCWDAGCGNNTTLFSTWKTWCNSCDTHSYDHHAISNYGIDTTTYRPLRGSDVIGYGVDLSGLGITALNSDKNGVARGASWDIGAYEYVQGGDTTAPAAPTGLRVN